MAEWPLMTCLTWTDKAGLTPNGQSSPYFEFRTGLSGKIFLMLGRRQLRDPTERKPTASTMVCLPYPAICGPAGHSRVRSLSPLNRTRA